MKSVRTTVEHGCLHNNICDSRTYGSNSFIRIFYNNKCYEIKNSVLKNKNFPLGDLQQHANTQQQYAQLSLSCQCPENEKEAEAEELLHSISFFKTMNSGASV